MAVLRLENAERRRTYAVNPVQIGIECQYMSGGAENSMAAMSDILLMVGRLNYVWTNTESLMIYLIVHLLKVEKEAAIVVFLTLNTTRARMDLIERLAKLPSTPAPDRKTILSIMARLKKESKTRNKYNHCIYSFDEKGEIASTQLMRLVEDETQSVTAR